VVAIYEIGCLFGSLFTFFMGEVFGRRRTIMLGCTVLCVGAALQTSSYGIPQLIVGRIVTGLGNGINTSTVPVWHSETTAAHNRGRALAIELAINIFGVVSGHELHGSSPGAIDL
jgi:MFS family permease